MTTANTGKNLPGTAGTAAGGGGPTWFNANNIKAADGANATVTFSDENTSDFLLATNFGFAIPATNVILGVIVYILGTDDFIFDGDPLQQNVSTWLYNNVIIGGAKSPSLTGLEVSAGTATDKWGLTLATLTPAIVNASTFGVAMQIGTGGYDSFGDVRIDYVKMDIFHAPSGVPKVGYGAWWLED